MANINVDLGTTSCTLGPYMFATFGGSYFHQDLQRADWRQLWKDIRFEMVRPNFDYFALTVDYWTSWKNFLLLDNFVPVTMQLPIATANIPSTQSDPTVAANVSATASYSPAAGAARYAEWVNAGIDVPWVEFGNEPEFTGLANFADRHQLPGLGYMPPTSVVNANQGIAWTMDWHFNHYNVYANAVRATASSLGKPVKIMALASANIAAPDAFTYMERFIKAVGSGNPAYGYDNHSVVDVVSWHSYSGVSGQQNANGWQFAINGIFEPSIASPQWSGAFGGLHQNDILRSWMDSYGFSGKGIALNEFELGDASAPDNHVGITSDALEVIAVCQGNVSTALGGSNWNVQNICFQSWQRSAYAPSTGRAATLFYDDPASGPNRRYYGLRDLVGPFLKNYKRQKLTTVSATGTTPSINISPYSRAGVDRIHAAAGISSDGSKLGVLVSNADVNTSESVTISYGVTPQGNVGGVYAPAGLPVGPLPTIAPFAAGSSFTYAIPAGTSYLFVIPIGGSPPPPTGPTVTSFAPTSGSPGDLIVLTGTGLDTATAVTFGGVSAAFAIDSDTQITATVPPLAVSGLITVTNLQGSGSSAASFTVLGAPTQEPNIGNWALAIQVNAGSDLPSPNPDQNLGNWTDPIRVCIFGVRVAGTRTDTARTVGTGRRVGEGGGGG